MNFIKNELNHISVADLILGVALIWEASLLKKQIGLCEYIPNRVDVENMTNAILVAGIVIVITAVFTRVFKVYAVGLTGICYVIALVLNGILMKNACGEIAKIGRGYFILLMVLLGASLFVASMFGIFMFKALKKFKKETENIAKSVSSGVKSVL